MKKLLLLPLGLLSMAGFCGGPSPPKPDRCDAPAMLRGPLTVELGGRDTPFRALSDGDQVAKEYGGQGGTMMPFRLRVSGSDVPGCLGQTTTMVDEASGEQLARLDAPLTTYPDTAGARATQINFLILDRYVSGGTPVRVTVSAGGTQVVRTVRLVDFIVTEDLASRD